METLDRSEEALKVAALVRGDALVKVLDLVAALRAVYRVRRGKLLRFESHGDLDDDSKADVKAVVDEAEKVIGAHKESNGRARRAAAATRLWVDRLAPPHVFAPPKPTRPHMHWAPSEHVGRMYADCHSCGIDLHVSIETIDSRRSWHCPRCRQLYCGMLPQP